ncbi:MAG: hypothetical protein JWO11_890 [Nocardioides sp.]|nr:hypothetical protein [Nocardioides sp.]
MTETHTLDSRAVLGLLAKAHQIFASDDTQLSFPLGSPVSFDAAAFSAATGPAPDAAGHALLAEFSTMMNWVPDGVVWPPAEPRSVDEIVRYIVGQAEWAVGDRTPEEEARVLEARGLVDLANPLMQDYCARKDAWIRSREQQRNNPDDPLTVEAESRAHLALLACPEREAIERAMDDLTALDERAPHRTREEMQRHIDVGIGTFDDPSVGRFSPVRPLPRDVIEAPQWDRVVLDRAALDELAAGAPAELTEHLQLSDAVDDPIVSISFEYASAQVHRDWLDERVFELRCWRFGDADRVLNDGAAPPHGDCPSYVRAIVLARNVTVTSKAPPGPAPVPSEPDSSIGFLLPETEVMVAESLLQRRLHVLDPDYATLMVEPPIEYVEPPAVAVATAEELVLPVDGVRAELLERPELISAVQPLRMFSAVSRARTLRATTGLSRTDLTLPLLRADAVTDFDYIFIPQDLPAAEPVTPEPTEQLVSQTTPEGNLILLALISKSIGKSPNPDSSFEWA